MKIFKIILTVSVIGALIGWMGYTLMNNKKEIDKNAAIKEEVITEIPVKVAKVELLPIDNTLKLTGTFEARKELNIIAETQGRLTKLLIDEGQQVKNGQVVAKIDDTSLKAQLNSAEASYEKAKKDVERFERLVKAGAISQQQYEDVKLGLNNAETNVTAMKQQLEYSIAHSPMTGVIKEVKVEEGSFATPGFTIATVVDISRLKMVVKVPETDIVKIKKGQKVTIETDVYKDKKFNGKVSLISVQADEGRKYDVEIELVNESKFPLKAGMYGTVTIQPYDSKKEFALFVPRRSVVGSIKNATVYVLQPDSTVKLTTVEVGQSEDDKVIIVHGLKENETIITTGQINLEDKKRVKVIEDIVSKN